MPLSFFFLLPRGLSIARRRRLFLSLFSLHRLFLLTPNRRSCFPSPSNPPGNNGNNSYALDVNLASLDVFNHKRLLDSARADPSAVSFQVRPVDVVALSTAASSPGGNSMLMRPSSTAEGRSSSGGLNRAPSFSSSHSLLAEAAAAGARAARPRAALPRPAFGSSPNLQVRFYFLFFFSFLARFATPPVSIMIACTCGLRIIWRLARRLKDAEGGERERTTFQLYDKQSFKPEKRTAR